MNFLKFCVLVWVQKILKTSLIFYACLICFHWSSSALAKELPLAMIPIQGGQAASANQILSYEIKRSAFFYLAQAQPGAFVLKARFVKKGLEGELLHPDGHQLFKRVYNNGVLKTDLRQLSDDVVHAATGHPGIATSQIAFISARNGKADIYVCDYDGKNIRQITTDGLPKRHPCLSPNGRFVYFTGMEPSSAGIYRIDLSNDQRSRIALTYGNASEKAVVSPDGKQLVLVLSEQGNSDLYISRNTGKSRRRLTSSPIAEIQPSWSGDGKSLVYTAVVDAGKTQLFVISSKDGKHPTALAIKLATPAQACWSPDGKRIAFVSGGSKNASITIHDLGDRSTRVLTRGQSPVWGADSRHLIYTDRGALYRIDANTGAKGQILSDGTPVYDPSWTR
ncbi:MAG: DPP IV N-terminal domain-containing protein [Verrucomicrobiota bacterium]